MSRNKFSLLFRRRGVFRFQFDASELFHSSLCSVYFRLIFERRGSLMSFLGIRYVAQSLLLSGIHFVGVGSYSEKLFFLV